MSINSRVPHISRVLREMWDTTAINPMVFGPRALRLCVRVVPVGAPARHPASLSDRRKFFFGLKFAAELDMRLL
jgi:hypothetical protein